MEEFKKILCIDFDGGLNCYNDKFTDELPPAKEGTVELLEELSLNYEIYVLSTRNPDKIKEWLIKNNMAKYVKEITDKKIPAYAYLDGNGIKLL